MTSNPFLTQHYGPLRPGVLSAGNEEDEEEEVDAAVGFSKIHNAKHITFTVFKPSKPRETEAPAPVRSAPNTPPNLFQLGVMGSSSSYRSDFPSRPLSQYRALPPLLPATGSFTPRSVNDHIQETLQKSSPLRASQRTDDSDEAPAAQPSSLAAAAAGETPDPRAAAPPSGVEALMEQSRAALENAKRIIADGRAAQEERRSAPTLEAAGETRDDAAPAPLAPAPEPPADVPPEESLSPVQTEKYEPPPPLSSVVAREAEPETPVYHPDPDEGYTCVSPISNECDFSSFQFHTGATVPYQHHQHQRWREPCVARCVAVALPTNPQLCVAKRLSRRPQNGTPGTATVQGVRAGAVTAHAPPQPCYSAPFTSSETPLRPRRISAAAAQTGATHSAPTPARRAPPPRVLVGRSPAGVTTHADPSSNNTPVSPPPPTASAAAAAKPAPAPAAEVTATASGATGAVVGTADLAHFALRSPLFSHGGADKPPSRGYLQPTKSWLQKGSS